MALKILLADDSMTAQNMGKKILVDAGYEVVPVSNGAQALKKIAEHKPQVAILDVYMPGYNGLEVCERLKNAPATAKLPVLLTVGKMEPYRPEEGARVGADGFIIKPFEASDLIAAVEKLVAAMVPSRVLPTNNDVEDPDSVDEFQNAQPWGQESVRVPEAMSSTPAMMGELLPAVAATEMHAVAGAHEAAFAVAASAIAPPISDWESGPSDFAVSPGAPEFLLDVPAPVSLGMVETAPGVEFTSAPQVGTLAIEQLNELETELKPEDVAAVGGQDPELEKDLTRIALDFPTQFGVDVPEEVTLGIVGPNETEFSAELESEVSVVESPVISEVSDVPAPLPMELGVTGQDELADEFGVLETIGGPTAEEFDEDPLAALSAGVAPELEAEVTDIAAVVPASEWTVEEAAVIPGEDDILLESMSFEERRPVVGAVEVALPAPASMPEAEVAPSLETGGDVEGVLSATEPDEAELLDVFSLPLENAAEEIAPELPAAIEMDAAPAEGNVLTSPGFVADEAVGFGELDVMLPGTAEDVESGAVEVAAPRENPWELPEAVCAPAECGSEYAEQWADAVEATASVAVAEEAPNVSSLEAEPVEVAHTGAPALDSERIANVIAAVFERHKSQMIAEIMQELAGE